MGILERLVCPNTNSIVVMGTTDLPTSSNPDPIHHHDAPTTTSVNNLLNHNPHLLPSTSTTTKGQHSDCDLHAKRTAKHTHQDSDLSRHISRLLLPELMECLADTDPPIRRNL